ncbi:MAG: hypothetical protein H6603_00690 [Flavobacteriales bacterium]|nr:hypothetical protein [Flavobacteriales bacterium]MCB9203464.1 hypothetical protein [Flavobacteriales bacterium]
MPKTSVPIQVCNHGSSAFPTWEIGYRVREIRYYIREMGTCPAEGSSEGMAASPLRREMRLCSAEDD